MLYNITKYDIMHLRKKNSRGKVMANNIERKRQAVTIDVNMEIIRRRLEREVTISEL